MMNNLIVEILLLPQFVLVFGLAIYFYSLRLINAPLLKRLYLLVLPLLALALPYLPIFLSSPTFYLAISLPAFVTGADISGDGDANLLSSDLWLIGIYFSGFVIVLLRFMLGLLQLFIWMFKAEKRSISGIDFYYNKAFKGSFSCTACIFSNKKHPEDVILQHELAHKRHFYYLDGFFAELLTAMWWFNPMIWKYRAYVKENHEWQVDQAVAQVFGNKMYVSTLIREAISSSGFVPSHSFSNSNQLKTRITMMNQVSKRKQAFLIGLTTIIGLMVAMPVLVSAFHFKRQDLVIAQQEPVKNQVEEMPEYPGGLDGMMKFLGDNIKYPKDDKLNKRNGQVIVSFVVDKTGAIKNAKVEKGATAAMDAEALRVVNKMPKWKPGKDKGKAVNVEYKLPISFKL